MCNFEIPIFMFFLYLISIRYLGRNVVVET